MESRITLSVDPTDPSQVAAALALFQKLSGSAATTSTGSAVPLETKPAKTVTKKATEPVKQEETKTTEPAADAATGEDLDGTKEAIKIEEVRTLLSKRVTEHRDKIKAKLTELGAPNVSTMKESDYPAFMDFLKGLK